MYDETKAPIYTHKEVQEIVADVLEDEKNPLGVLIIMVWFMVIGIFMGWLVWG